MPGPNESYKGHVFSALAIFTSWVLSLHGAWLPELGWGCALLVVITCFAEPSKYFANRVLWSNKRVGFWARALALLWYLVCITASVGLMQLPMLLSLAKQETAQHQQDAQREALAARQGHEITKLEAEHRDAKTALEDARTAVVPGIRSSVVLRRELVGQLSTRDRKALDQELATAVANEQLAGKITRLSAEIIVLEEKLVKSRAERSRTFSERSSFSSVLNVQNVQERMNALSIAAAIVLELAIGLGIWADTRYNAGEAAPAAPATPPKSLPAPQNDGARRFEAWLYAEWKRRRGQDGWLEGTQQGWARSCGLASSFVHAQLKRLHKAGRIDLRTSPKNTWVRFVKVGELKSVT